MYPSLDLDSLPRKLVLQQNNRQDFIVSIFAFSREWSTVSVTRTSFAICKNIVLFHYLEADAVFIDFKVSLILITFHVNDITDISWNNFSSFFFPPIFFFPFYISRIEVQRHIHGK